MLWWPLTAANRRTNQTPSPQLSLPNKNQVPIFHFLFLHLQSRSSTLRIPSVNQSSLRLQTVYNKRSMACSSLHTKCLMLCLWRLSGLLSRRPAQQGQEFSSHRRELRITRLYPRWVLFVIHVLFSSAHRIEIWIRNLTLLWTNVVCMYNSVYTTGAEEGDGYVPEECLSFRARSSRGQRRCPSRCSVQRCWPARTRGFGAGIPRKPGQNRPDPGSPDWFRHYNAPSEASASQTV